MNLLLLLACVETGAPKDEASPDDTAVPVDTDDTDIDTGDTDVDTDETASDTDTGPDDTDDTAPGECVRGWPDRAVAIDTACPGAPVVDWNLREVWRYERAEFWVVTPHAGRFTDSDHDGAITAGDPMALWAVAYTNYSYGDAHVLLDAEGVEARADTSFGEAYRSYGRTAEFDATRVGMEIATTEYIYRDANYWTASDDAGRFRTKRLPDTAFGVPWFVDLDLDGAPEVLLAGTVVDPLTGDVRWELEDADPWIHTVAADLDRDGVPEVVTEAAGGLGIWSGGLAAPVVCPVARSTDERAGATFAIANLDDDADAEVLRADMFTLSLCDADGTLLAEGVTDSVGGALIGVGELDGDPEPEIVLDYNGVVDGTTNVSGIVVYDETLTEVWRRPSELVGWNPFSLADLDGDGVHEIVVREAYALTILDGTGATLASIEAGYGNNHWKNVPLVVDLDGDGLAEIVTSGESPAVQVWANDAGGWRVAGADVPAPGVDQHPGILEVDGTVPAATDWWNTANVWQGLPAGAAALPDVEVTIDYVCADGCLQDLFVTVYVANTGAGDLIEPVALTVARADGTEIASVHVDPPILAGTARAVDLRVSPDDAREGLQASVDAAGAVLECDETDNTAAWTDTLCP